MYFTNETGSCRTIAQLLQNVHGLDITHDNVCSMLSCFFSYVTAMLTGHPVSSFYVIWPIRLGDTLKHILEWERL